MRQLMKKITSARLPHTKQTILQVLFLVGSYQIGKEKVALAVARGACSKVFAEAAKRRVLGVFDWPELNG